MIGGHALGLRHHPIVAGCKNSRRLLDSEISQWEREEEEEAAARHRPMRALTGRFVKARNVERRNTTSVDI